MKRTVLLAVLLAVVGCSAKLPPHVWMKVEPIVRVDMFWWTDTKLCSLRVITEDRGNMVGFDVSAPAELCIQRLKSDGWDISGVVAKKAGKP